MPRYLWVCTDPGCDGEVETLDPGPAEGARVACDCGAVMRRNWKAEGANINRENLRAR